MIIEFDPETFRLLLDYLHTGSCPLTCANIPGLICAAEHYDLPDLLQACFHHAKQFLRIEVVSFFLVRSNNVIQISIRHKSLKAHPGYFRFLPTLTIPGFYTEKRNISYTNVASTNEIVSFPII